MDGVALEARFDGHGRAVELLHKRVEELLTGFAYGYDRAGNRHYEADLASGKADAYLYDSADRLTDTKLTSKGD